MGGFPYERVSHEDGNPTFTWLEEERVDEMVGGILARGRSRELRLGYEQHAAYAARGLSSLPASVGYLDASRTWLCYWNGNATDVMNLPMPPGITSERIVATIASFFVDVTPDSGGFGGGPNQIPHLAPTYSAVLSLLIAGTPEAYELLKSKKEKLVAWFKTLKNADGSVIMHEGGEVDVRGCYCMLLVCTLLGITDKELLEGVTEFVASCQTFEGGFGCRPYEEAHGGYTFCGIASLALARAHSLIDLDLLRKWLSRRQCPSQGGFNGRTNKLVDSCYSFWVGAAHAIADALAAEDRRVANNGVIASAGDALLLDMIAYEDIEAYAAGLGDQDNEGKAKDEAEGGDDEGWVDITEKGLLSFDQEALQNYVLTCCQNNGGGLFDKPGMRPDHYHTNYSLTGLAISQNLGREEALQRLTEPARSRLADLLPPEADPVFITDPRRSRMSFVNPIFAVRRCRAAAGLAFFHKSPLIPGKRS